MKPTLVIFDCDGVLIDSEHLGCIAETRVFRRHGLDMADDFIVNHCIGLSFKSSMKLVEEHFNWPVSDACVADIIAETKHIFETELTAISGIADLLDNLKLPRCVASSSAPERLQHSLGLVGLYDRLAPHIFSATMVKNGKPAPDLFLHAARKMGHAPETCVVIEDSIAGVTAGKAAGMTVIGFTGGSHVLPGLGARLTETGADAVVSEMQEVARILGV